MLDFTCALYLRREHPSSSLGTWTALTTGRPAALDAHPLADDVERRLAGLVGTKSSLLGASTFHLFWDLFDALSGEPILPLLDSGAYPIARWGAERAAVNGRHLREFRHYDPASLRATIGPGRPGGAIPIVVADGCCPACGRSAPVAEYLEALQPYHGLLVLDDTQALGILGTRDGSCPYGSGGGGSLRWTGVRSDNVLLISSLAKAFGAPLAALCASEATIRWFRDVSSTRVHCSPPSAAALHAAASALRWNLSHGDAERRRLHRLVREFRAQASLGGLMCRGGDFPVQTPVLPSGIDVPLLHAELKRRGVGAVLHRSRTSGGAALSFLITSGHGIADIRHAVGMLHACLRHTASSRQRRVLAYGNRIQHRRS